MAARAYRITADTARILTDAADFTGPRVTITEHVGAAWAGVKSTLERMGAVYRVGTSAFDFEPDQDAAALVAAALAAGSVMAASAADGFVPTPATLAEDVVERFGLLYGCGRLSVLEPSAGTGAFVDMIAGVGSRAVDREWLTVHAVEPNARRLARIDQDDRPNVTAFRATLEEFAASGRALGTRYDRVIMNPPFSVPGNALVWIDHVLTAWELLAPGGRLAAIVPAAVLSERVGRKHTELRALIARHGGMEEQEADAFAESGKTVATAVVWLDRPMSDQPVTLPARPHPYVVPDTRAVSPVRVSRPFTSPAAAESMPVQVLRDSWRDTERVLRYAGDCAACGVVTWAFEDGENDPRGMLGDATAYGLDAAGYDAFPVLPHVVLCALCANTGDAYDRGVTLARAYWETAAVQLAADVRDDQPAPVPAPVAVVEPAPADVDQDTDADPWAAVLDGDQYALPL